MDQITPKKRRGRPSGSGKKTGPRPGSRPYALSKLGAGDDMWIPVKSGQAPTNLMQQIAADISRVGLNGKVTQSLFIAIQPTTRAVVDLIRVTRFE